jgi:zinc transport system permease protein
MIIGVAAALAGVSTSFYSDTPSGGTIVLYAIGLFIVVAIANALRSRRRRGLPAGRDGLDLDAGRPIPTGSHS